VLVAHNEDWVPEDEPDVFMLHARPDDEPPFLAMTYGALLPNIGLNAYGIAQVCDSVYPGDSRIGIPRVVNSRAVLAARTPGEAIRHTLVRHRAAGYNHLLVHESGEMYNVEVSSRRFALLPAEDGLIAHTNHYLDPQMQAIETDPDELVATRVRYMRAMHLLKQVPLHNVKTLQAIQKDHVNHPDSICNHANEAENPLDREKTITALLIDVTKRQIHATWGNPCESAYYTYQLE
jgi:isopenicillin-N N-acyltransferase-like protein